MSKFKIGDWVLDDEDTLFQVCSVEDNVISLVDEPYYVLAKDFRPWTPKEGEWCFFNMKIDCVWQSPILMRYGEQDMRGCSIEPFVGTLPSFCEE